jgi:hypothetical protein
MKSKPVLDLYKKSYIEFGFERTGLFRLVRERYGCEQALYPGCFSHITPSFYFPHVVYVDKHPAAIDFFTDIERIVEYVNRKKTYKRSTFLRFIPQDYSTSLPLKEGQFDLLISLYAADISQTCKRYLKTGGLLLTNNFHGDARSAEADPQFQPVSIVQYRKKAYRLVEDLPTDYLSNSEKAVSKKYLRQVSHGFEYSEVEDYFIFRKGLVVNSIP